jgi:hypothetical protein
VRRRTVEIAAFHIAVAFAFRLFCIWRYRIDSDEPQHLHVVWGWANGLVPYRDFYDNHLPLFHLLFTPLFAASESDGILTAGRIAMLPLALAAVALTWALAARLYDRNVAFWCALATSIMPSFLLKGVEFRNDNLWNVGVLAATLLAIGTLGVRRAFFIGLVLGVTLLASLKTVYIAAALVLALLLIHRRAISWKMAAAFASGCGLPALLAAAWFASQGALDDLWRCTIAVNGLVAIPPLRRAAGALAFVVSLALAYHFTRRLRPDRALVAATASIFTGSVMLLAPFVGEREFTAITPMLMAFATAAFLPRLGRAVHALPAALILLTVMQGDMHRPARSYDRAVIQQTLALTRAGEPVLDLKGETIFRARATFIGYEPVGREMIARGIVADTLPRDVVQAFCYVATRDSDFFPPAARRFLSEHFVVLGDVRIAGQRVRDDGTFTIAIPGEYVVVDAQGAINGAPRFFSQGVRRLSPHPPGATVVWRGIERVAAAPPQVRAALRLRGVPPSGEERSLYASRELRGTRTNRAADAAAAVR